MTRHVEAMNLMPGDELPGGKVIKSLETSDDGKFIVARFFVPEGAMFWFDVFPLDSRVEVV